MRRDTASAHPSGPAATTVAAPPILAFGTFELDVGRRELRRGGARVRLQDKPLELLLALLERPGEAMSREALQGRLWPHGTHVDAEAGINSAVRRLRRVLGDTADRPRFVETVARRGYRFIAPVSRREVPPPAPAVAGSARRLPARGLAAARLGVAAAAVVAVAFVAWRASTPPASTIRSLAVLPLISVSSGPDQEYLVAGLHEALVAQLGAVEGLQVISRTSVMRYHNTEKPLPEIARELGVDGVVEGSVTLSGQRVRITVALLDARADRRLWAASFERELRDALALQGEIAREVAWVLQGRLAASHPAPATGIRPSFAAQDAYLRGRFLWNKRTRPAVDRAVWYFTRATELEPRWAIAHAALADAYFVGGGSELAVAERTARARAAARAALARDPRCGEAHAVLGKIAFHDDWHLAEAERHLRRAVELAPSYPTGRQWYATFLARTGRAAEGLPHVEVALRLDPLSPPISTAAGYVHFRLGNVDEAVRHYERTLELEPDNRLARFAIARAHVLAGRHEQALIELGRLDPSDADYAAARAHALVLAGRRSEALSLLAQLESAHGERRPGHFRLAEVHVVLGDTGRVFELLAQSRQDREDELLTIAGNPWFASLRGDRRFTSLLRDLGLRPPAS